MKNVIVHFNTLKRREEKRLHYITYSYMINQSIIMAAQQRSIHKMA